MVDRHVTRVRSMFLSDIHLGTRGCKAEELLGFLRRYDADTIYLVGDIVDGWRLKSGWYWPQSHNDVVQKLLRKVRKGAVPLLHWDLQANGMRDRSCANGSPEDGGPRGDQPCRRRGLASPCRFVSSCTSCVRAG